MTGALESTALREVALGDGLTVTALGYGGMSLSPAYGPISPDEAVRTVHHALDAGIRFIDTANIYGGGDSERAVGRAVAGHRDELVIATKFGIDKGPVGGRQVRGEPAYVHAQIDLSLQRLGLDHVDLYYQHRIAKDVPIEETVGAMSELVAAGKVRHLGLSEATADELRRAHAVHPIAAVQSEWSLLSRDVELSVIPAAIETGAGFVPYAALSRGMLTDRFTAAQIGPGDIRPTFPRFTPENLARNEALRTELRALAADSGLTSAQLALAWLFDRGARLGIAVAPIPGSRFAAHIDEWLPATGAALDADVVAALDTFADRVAGPRHLDPQWTSVHGDL